MPDLRRVATARGPIGVDDLGRVLTHEHLFVVDAEQVENYWTSEQIDSLIETAAERLDIAADAGIDSVLDLTVHGVGRLIGWIARLAAKTRVNLLVSTGVFATSRLPRVYSNRGPGTLLGGVDPMIERFVADIESGIGPSGVRAAALKCVIDAEGLTPDVERCLRAVAAAQVTTGVPVFTHTDARHRGGLDQQRILAAEGADLTKVVIGHCGDTTDLDYLERLLDAGSYVGLDRFGWVEPVGLKERCDVVAQLVKRGWVDRIMLSHDAALFHSWMDEEVKQVMCPDSSFDYLPMVVLPELVRRGVPRAAFNHMLVANPRRLWSKY